MAAFDKYLRSHDRNTTGNYADYNLCVEGLICCGNMELHDDYGYGCDEHSPFFTILPHYWDPEYVLVVTNNDGEFEMIEQTSDPITFNGTLSHGFMPREVGVELVIRQCETGPLYTAFERDAHDPSVPRLIWSWVLPT